MDLSTCTETLRQRMGEASGLEATLKFDCNPAGVVFLDGRSVPNQVDNVDREADCTIGISLDNLDRMLRGELDPTTAFMMGKLKVAGDMSIALKLKRFV